MPWNLMVICLAIFLSGKCLSNTRDSLMLLLETDTSSQAKIYNEIAKTCVPDSLDAAFHYTNKALKIALKEQNHLETGNSYDILGDYYYYLNDFKSSSEFYEKALDVYDQVGNKEGVALEYHNIGLNYYFIGLYHKSVNYSRKALEIRQGLDDKRSAANSLFNIALIYKKWGNYSEAIKKYEEAKKIYEIYGDDKGIANSLTNIANVYRNISEYEKATEYYIQALEIYETNDDMEGEANVLTNLGLVYRIWGYLERAIEMTEKAMDVFIQLDKKSKTAHCYTSLGVCYMKKKEYDKAFGFMNKSIEIKKEIDDQSGLIISYLDIGNNYSEIKNYHKAKSYYQNALNIASDINDRKNTCFALHNLGAVANELENYSEARGYILQSIEIAGEIGQNEMRMLNYAQLAKSLYGLGNKKSAYFNLKKHRALKDSIFADKARMHISELQTKYESAKKDEEILLLKKDGELLEAELHRKKEYIKRRNTFILIIFIGLLLTIVFSAILYRLLRERKMANRKLKEQNMQILMQNNKIEEQNDKIAFQRNELMHEMESTNQQKDLISAQKKEIVDSISYARIIQNAVFPPENVLRKNFENYFLFHKTKFQVHSDFYWISEYNNQLYVVVAESNNVDVPGALMGMLGMAILGDLIHQDRVHPANEILNLMRKKLVKSLHLSENIDTDSRDGLNLALCVFNKDRSKMEYAGACLPVILMDNQGIKVLESDEMSIGLSSRMVREFRSQIVKLESNTTIIMHSLGLKRIFTQDQFISVCENVYFLPFEQQKKILIERVNGKIDSGVSWKDLLLFGFKVN